MHRITLMVVASLGIAACVTTQSQGDGDPQVIEAVQPGDQRLSCAELRDETARMDGYIRESNRVEAERQRDGGTNAATSTAAGYVPLGGLLYNIGVMQPRTNEYVTVRERGNQAMRRKETLTTFFNQKSCA